MAYLIAVTSLIFGILILQSICNKLDRIIQMWFDFIDSLDQEAKDREDALTNTYANQGAPPG